MYLGQAYALGIEPAYFSRAKNHRLCSYKLILLTLFPESSFLNHDAFQSSLRSPHCQSLALHHTYSPPTGPHRRPPHPLIHLHAITLEVSQHPDNRQWAHQRDP